MIAALSMFIDREYVLTDQIIDLLTNGQAKCFAVPLRIEHFDGTA